MITQETIEKIILMYGMRCAVLDLSFDDKQQAVLKGVLLNYQQIAGKTSTEIIAMVDAGELTEGGAAFWLGINRLELRKMIHGATNKVE